MARYASALLAKSRGIVRPETFDAMVAPQWCPDDRLASSGLAFVRGRAFGRRTLRHGGGISGGWNTFLDIYPDDGLAVLTHLNLSFDRFGDVTTRLSRAALGAPETPLPTARPIDARVLEAAPGVYEAPMPGPLTNFRIAIGTGRVQITNEDGALVLRARRGPWKDGARMLPADEHDPAFFALEVKGAHAGNVALVRDADGGVTGMRFDGLVELVRNHAIEPWA